MTHAHRVASACLLLAACSRPPAPPPASGQVFVVTNGLGSGEVKISLAKEGCGIDCPELFGKGAAARLLGRPSPGSRFDGFSGPCTGRVPCVVPLDKPRWVAASFSDAAARYQGKIGDGHPTPGSARALALDLGGGLFVAGSGDAWLGRYDRDGKKLWDLAGDVKPAAVAFDRATDIVVVGRKNAGADGFVAKRGAAGGPAWEHTLANGAHPTDVCIDGAGDILVVGTFPSVVKLGKLKIDSAGGMDVFIARFAPDGTPRDLLRLGGAADERAARIATDGAATTFVSYVEGAVDRYGSAENGAARVVTFSPLGRQARETVIGGKSRIDTLRATPEGELVLAGRFSEGIDIGGKKLRSNGGTDALVAKIDRSGAVQWAKSFGGKDDDEAAALDLDRSGRVAAIGNFQNEAEFGATTLTAKTYPRTWHAGKSFGMVGTDAWLAVLSPEGEVASAKAFGGAGTDWARGVAWAEGGDVVLRLDQEELVVGPEGGVASLYVQWILRRPPDAP
jgi:hypothetical protein